MLLVLTRLAYDRANARDLIAISDALSRMPRLQGLVNESSDGLLISLGNGLTKLEPIKIKEQPKILFKFNTWLNKIHAAREAKTPSNEKIIAAGAAVIFFCA